MPPVTDMPVYLREIEPVVIHRIRSPASASPSAVQFSSATSVLPDRYR